MEFGEVVQFIPFRAEARADKFDEKLREGVRLGLGSRTHENIIGTSYGMYRASTIKGVPEDQRWDSVKALAVVALPEDGYHQVWRDAWVHRLPIRGSRKAIAVAHHRMSRED